MYAEQLLPEPSHPGIVHYVVVRAVTEDPDLWQFDSRRETTRYPSEYLWGPGSHSEACAWVQSTKPQADEVECLDRLFLIRQQDSPFAPYRPEACATLDRGERDGTWHLVLADHPADAAHHVRSLSTGLDGCSAVGPCSSCSAESRVTGAWTDVIAGYEAAAGTITKELSPDVAVPARLSRSRATTE